MPISFLNPTLLLGALASALPVVAVRATCVPEIIHDGINGYLVNPGDIENMAQRIVDVLENPEMAKRMGKAGRKVAESHSVQASISSHEAHYKRIISQPVIHLKRTKPALLWRFFRRLEKFGLI